MLAPNGAQPTSLILDPTAHRWLLRGRDLVTHAVLARQLQIKCSAMGSASTSHPILTVGPAGQQQVYHEWSFMAAYFA